MSLGWCFWHRGCFGCLLCGCGLDAPLDNVGEGEELEGPEKRRKGIELEYIPLCTWCENATEGKPDKEVLESGLVNVTKKDGGLTRSRLDRLTRESETSDADGGRQRARTLTRSHGRGESGLNAKQVADQNKERGSFLELAADSGLGEDGNVDSLSGGSTLSEQMGHVPAPAPTVYVSVLDPIGEPSFRPSKTKPLPKWMALLPSNRQHKEQGGIGSSISQAPAGPNSVAPVLITPNSLEFSIQPTQVSDSKPQEPHLMIDDLQVPQPGSLIRIETASSIYRTPPQSPESRPQRTRTPYPFIEALPLPRPAYPETPGSYFSCPPGATTSISPVSVDGRTGSTRVPRAPTPFQVRGGSFKEDYERSSERAQRASSVTSRRPSLQRNDYLYRALFPTPEQNARSHFPKDVEPVLNRFKRQKTGDVMAESSVALLKKEELGKLNEDGRSSADCKKDELRRELMGLFGAQQRHRSWSGTSGG